MIRSLVFVAVFLAVACATPHTPQDSCARDLEIQGPERAAYHVDLACRYFENRTGHKADLSRASILVDYGERPRAILSRNPEIFADRSGPWERQLHHEVWHVLLWRSAPEIDTEDHHRRMLDLGLCQPVNLCGYGPHAPQVLE